MEHTSHRIWLKSVLMLAVMWACCLTNAVHAEGDSSKLYIYNLTGQSIKVSTNGTFHTTVESYECAFFWYYQTKTETIQVASEQSGSVITHQHVLASKPGKTHYLLVRKNRIKEVKNTVAELYDSQIRSIYLFKGIGEDAKPWDPKIQEETQETTIYDALIHCRNDANQGSILLLNTSDYAVKLYFNDRFITSLKRNELLSYRLSSEGRISITAVNYAGRETEVVDIKNDSCVAIEMSRSFTGSPSLNFVNHLSEGIIANVLKTDENPRLPIIQDGKQKSGMRQGTCFLISQKGYLLTNYHVIEDVEKIEIYGVRDDPFETVSAIVVAKDVGLDLALLKITDDNLALPAVPYVINAEKQLAGTESFVLGYPLTTAMGNEIKVTNGIISSNSGYKGSLSQYQLSAAIQPGNSGSPLFNQNGEVIGIINAGLVGAENAGYAIKAVYVQTFLSQVDGVTFNSSAINTENANLVEQVASFKDFVYIIKCE